MESESKLSLAAVDQIRDTVRFIMSDAESEFLVSYIRWRMDHPIVKQ
jgi:hypothetical protein